MWSKLSFGKKVAVFIVGGVLINALAFGFICFYTIKNGKLPRDFARLFDSELAPYVSEKDKAPKDIKDATAAISKNPKDAMAYAKRAAAKEVLSDYKGAVDDYDKAINLSPTTADYYFKRALVYSNNRHSDSLRGYKECNRLAIRDFAKALELAPENGAIWSKRAAFYVDMNDHEKAIKDYSTAIKLKWNLRNNYTERGDAYQVLKKYDEAISDYESALDTPTKRDGFAAFKSLLKLYVARDDLKNANRVADAWVAEYSDDIAPFLFRAKLKRLQGNDNDAKTDDERAIAILSNSIEQNEDSPYDYERRAHLYKQLGEKEKAKADFKQALSLFEDQYKDESWIDSTIANIKEELGDKVTSGAPKAEELNKLSAEIIKNPKNAHNYHDRGQLFEQNDNYQAARSDYAAAWKLAPKNRDYERHLTDMDLKFSEYSRPLAYQEKLLKERPKDPDALNALASIYNATGKFEKAILLAKNELELDFTDAAAYRNLGVALEKSGDAEHGRKNILKAEILEYDPD